jgi:hypothetical protein
MYIYTYVYFKGKEGSKKRSRSKGDSSDIIPVEVSASSGHQVGSGGILRGIYKRVCM